MVTGLRVSFPYVPFQAMSDFNQLGGTDYKD
jgi:hypothetical protein